SLLLRVVEPGSGTPVANAHVEARRVISLKDGDEDAKQRVPLLVTRDGEAWRLLGAGAANEVTLSAPGHATSGVALPGAPPEARVELPPEAVLAGRVVDEQGQPIPQATVCATPPADLPVKLDQRTARADASGAFRLDALAAGAWSLLP